MGYRFFSIIVGRIPQSWQPKEDIEYSARVVSTNRSKCMIKPANHSVTVISATAWWAHNSRESSLGLLQSLGKTLLTLCAKLFYTGLLQKLEQTLLRAVIVYSLCHVSPCIPGTCVCHGQPVLRMCLCVPKLMVARDVVSWHPAKIGDHTLCIQA